MSAAALARIVTDHAAGLHIGQGDNSCPNCAVWDWPVSNLCNAPDDEIRAYFRDGFAAERRNAEERRAVASADWSVPATWLAA